MKALVSAIAFASLSLSASAFASNATPSGPATIGPNPAAMVEKNLHRQTLSQLLGRTVDGGASQPDGVGREQRARSPQQRHQDPRIS